MDSQMTFLMIICVMQFFIICWMFNCITKINSLIKKIGTVIGTNYLNIQQLCTQMNKIEKEINNNIEIKVDYPGVD